MSGGDTIYALASASGRAGVSVVRLSGPAAFEIARGLTATVPDSRGLRTLRDADDDVIDRALVLSFPAGQSFTGEAVVEFQCHGSLAIIAALTRRLGELGARLADPGEFTRRALENGQLDLAQVEGLADLIDAETDAQRRQAMRVFSGALGALTERWRAQLIRAAALIEATIDFVDEDVPIDVYPEVLENLAAVQSGIQDQLAASRASERIRDGFEVAIVGPPNIGKSTLLNRLAGRDAAITSQIAGTTRDVIEVRMDLGGLAVTLLDTAGIRETDDEIERLGVDLARRRAERADLRIFLTEADGMTPFPPRADDIVLQGKADDGGGVSGTTGAGVPELLDEVSAVLTGQSANAGLAIRERHRSEMRQALQAISVAIERIDANGEADLVAEDIRAAIRSLDGLVGRVGVEDLLGEVFSSFCIGK